MRFVEKNFLFQRKDNMRRFACIFQQCAGLLVFFQPWTSFFRPFFVSPFNPPSSRRSLRRGGGATVGKSGDCML